MSKQQLSIGCSFAVVPFDAVISTINSNDGAKELKESQQKAFVA
jgi:hypothetical protein